MDIYVFIFLVLVAAPISTFVHECGHAIGAKIVASDRITLTIGVGRRIGTISLKTVHITFHMIFFLGGYTRYERKRSYQSRELIWISILGPISSFIFAFLCYFMYDLYSNNYMKILLLFNVWLTIMNIIPFKIKDKLSDGYAILKILTNKHNM